MTSGHEQEPADFPDAEGRDPQETAGPVPGAAGEPAPSEEPVEAPAEPGGGEGFGALTDVADLVDAEAVPPGVGLAVIAGLVDDVSVEAGRDSGLVVRMTWPTA